MKKTYEIAGEVMGFFDAFKGSRPAIDNERILIVRGRSRKVIPLNEFESKLTEIGEILGATEYFDDSKDVELPTVCPYCGSKLEEEGANIFCRNLVCRPRVIAAFANFASKEAMNIDGFSEKTAAVLYDNFGMIKYHELYELSVDKLLKLEGFQIKKTNKFSKTIYLSRHAGRSFHRTVCLRERVKVNRYIASKFAAEQILKVKFPIKMTNAMKAFGRAREPFRKRVLE